MEQMLELTLVKLTMKIKTNHLLRYFSNIISDGFNDSLFILFHKKMKCFIC
jgi:hypothetical protein